MIRPEPADCSPAVDSNDDPLEAEGQAPLRESAKIALKDTDQMVSSLQHTQAWPEAIMPPSVIAYCSLSVAIVCELLGTAFLKKSEQFTNIGASLTSGVFYAASFFFLAQALKFVPLGVAYAIWGGVGIAITAVIGVVMFRQPLDLAGMIGIGLIVSGVVVINISSNTASN